jgi:tetratricopeptide (TPR) repeat protein
MSVADHHVVPGKKFWTWGNGPRGRMWDKILTDTDGPYIELMVGAYSDNQPDYSWLQPFETKSVEMYWYPFRQIGGVKNANLDAGVNLEVKPDHTANVGFCTTRAYRSAEASLTGAGKVLLREEIAIDPAKPYVKRVSLPPALDEYALHASLRVDGKELVGYSPVRQGSEPMPTPVTDPPSPKEVKTIEELYLAGQRIEQFHNANLDPEAYWQEALNRDPDDARVNTSLGIRRLKEERFAEAEQCFRKALERLTANYTAPKNGEAFYYLGLALDTRGWDQPSPATAREKRAAGAQDRWNEARDAFYQATWSEAWRGSAYFALAEIATRQSDYARALDCVNRSLDGNQLNVRALGLKAALLRHTGHVKEALGILDLAVRKTDPLDARLMAERWLAGDKKATRELSGTLRDFPTTGLETAAEYSHAGLWSDGTALLNLLIDSAKDQKRVSPLAYYYLAQFAERLSKKDKAAEYRRQAVAMPPDYVFPFQWEAQAVLREAIAANPADARAPYYLGNLLFDSQPEEAVKLWEKSAALDPGFPITHRNLALAYRHEKPKPDLSQAIAQLEMAIAAPEKYALHFSELDELYALTYVSPQKRLALLEENHAVVAKRDDALSREIGLKVFAGKYDDAIRLMTGRKFSVWEGGSLEVVDHWVNAHLLRGRQRLAGSRFAAALQDFQAAGTIPENLPTERELARQAELAYWAGFAYEGLGDTEKAKESWRQAAEAAAPEGRRGPRGRSSVRDEQGFFQALAKRKLGQTAEADEVFHRLVQAADRNREEVTEIKEQETSVSKARLHYVAGLGYLGLGETDKAKAEFQTTLEALPDHLGAESWLRAGCRL